MNERKGAAWRQARTRKGYLASKVVRHRKAQERWLALVARYGPEKAVAVAYLRGYTAGLKARHYPEVSDARRAYYERQRQAREAGASA